MRFAILIVIYLHAFLRLSYSVLLEFLWLTLHVLEVSKGCYFFVSPESKPVCFIKLFWVMENIFSLFVLWSYFHLVSEYLVKSDLNLLQPNKVRISFNSNIFGAMASPRPKILLLVFCPLRISTFRLISLSNSWRKWIFSKLVNYVVSISSENFLNVALLKLLRGYEIRITTFSSWKEHSGFQVETVLVIIV